MDPVPFHFGIVTDDLPASMSQLSRLLGVTWTEPGCGGALFHDVDGTPQPQPRSCISREGPIHVDLIQGQPGSLWAAAGGAALHHFAYWTDDLAGDIERLAGHGYRLELTQPDDAGRPATFAYLVRADGFRVELIDQAGQEAYAQRLAEGPSGS